MAPPTVSGKHREEFVKWKEAIQSMDCTRTHAAGSSPSFARVKKHVSRPLTSVMSETDLQIMSESTQVPQNRRDRDSERETELEVGAWLKRPPQIPKYAAPYKFVPPRATGPSTSAVSAVLPPQAMASPQGRPSKRVQQLREDFVHDAPCTEHHNSSPHTSAKYREGK
jgi:hypothetical protein